MGAVTSILLPLLAIEACGGDFGAKDAPLTQAEAEAGPEPSGDAATRPEASDPVGDERRDGGAPSCRGQTFKPPTLVNTTQISGALATTMWGPRVVGQNAYFAAVPAGGNEQQIFRATWSPGAAPSLSNAAAVAPPSSASVVEWAPAVSADSALLVFGTAFPPPRNLSYALGSGGGFAASNPITSVNTAADESDPFLVGKPAATALYFGREDGAQKMEIWRSAITSGPVFEEPQKATLTCPEANCGTPVVTTDERTAFFASWGAGGFLPNVNESDLQVSATGAVIAGPAIGHPELGARYPSWISEDGCEVLLGGGGISTVSDIFHARRVAK